ncbi:MAG: hypothetical protein ACI4UL_09715 [Muribaculaceae bacterium]
MKKLDKKTVQRIQGVLLALGMVMLVVSAAFPLLGVWPEGMLLMRYIFAAGAATVLAVRLTEVYEGKNLRVKRLHSLERVSAFLYCVSAFLLFYYGNRLGGGDWIAFLLAGAIMQIYTSFMIQHEEEKDAKKA